MRLDNQKFNFHLIKKGENIIRCNKVEEAFFNVFDITLNEDVAFIKPADRYIDGCPVVKLNVECKGKIYKDVEFKVVKSDEHKVQVYVNEKTLVSGFRFEEPEVEDVVIEQAQEISELIEAPIVEEEVQLHNWQELSEQAKQVQENKIVNFVGQVREDLSQRIDEMLEKARRSILAETMNVYNRSENMISKKINETESNLSQLVEQWERATEIKISEYIVGAIDDVRCNIEKQFEEIVQEQQQDSLHVLSEKIAIIGVESKQAIKEQLQASIVEQVETLRDIVKDADDKSKAYIDERLHNFGISLFEKNTKAFDNVVASFVERQTTWLTEYVNSKVVDVKQALMEATHELEKDNRNLKKQLRKDAAKAIDEAADKITETAVRKVVDEVIAEQVASLQSDENALMTEARGARKNLFKDALGSLRTEMNTHVTNLQQDLYKKFAIYAQSYAGGGTVAQQFADGGTMNGTLNVNAPILSGGVNLFDIFATDAEAGYQTLAFNTSTGELTISPNGNTVVTTTASAFNAQFIDFNYSLSANPAYREARLFYDNEYNALTVNTEIPGVSFRLGRDMGIIGVNKTGSPIAKGTVVYLSGTQGAQRPKMWPALATTDLRSADTIGLTMHQIADNNEGYIMTLGELDGINTSNIPAGVTLYLSSTAAGQFTNVKPQAPDHLVKIGFSLNSTNNGRIYIEIDNGYELDELHNVRITSPANGQVLAYDAATSLWKNTNQSGGGASGEYLPLSGGTLTGIVSTNQDIEITDATKGIIIKSPGGFKYRVTVSDAGELITSLI